MSFSKRNLGSKIYLSLGLTGAFLLVVGGVSIYSISALRGLLENTARGEVRKIELATRISEQVASGQSALRGALLASMTGDAAGARAAQNQMEAAGRAITAALAEIEPLVVTAEGREDVRVMKAATEEWLRQTRVFDEHLAAQRYDEATRMEPAVFRPMLSQMQKAASDLTQRQRQRMEEATASAAARAQVTTWLAVLLVLSGAVVAAAAFWVMRGANSTLRRIAAQIADGARQVASAAQQVSSSAQALAQGSSEQAASLEQTSASTEELNSMTQKNAENASMAAGETEKADQLLKETNEKLDQMIESMKEINASSEKISRIIRVIDEIAFQTNILALNAAVEAARAGEAGMGFAVVADEVRNLAQRCAQAAKDTSDLIEESIVRSNEGKLRLDEVAACITRVFENASRIRVLTNEVHMGSQEQARGIEQIARAVAQMQQVTQSTAASAEESASAGEEMSAQAQQLQAAVERLRELVGASDDERTVPAVPAPAVRRMAAPAARPVGVKTAARMEIPLEDDFRDF
ncbi:MAG: methyl-accepting chemotaxis protein [Bryobacteraceae bacterium]|nr:methyl-accepting chemotaxis protein [Bryobacteraceae bacterium]